MAKNYVIFYDNKVIVFPVKAKLNPYKEKTPAFCGGCPQFFGGKPEKEGVFPTLQREVAEESILTRTLLDGTLNLFFETKVKHYGNWVPYGFYSTTDWKTTGTDWPSEENWRRLDAQYREMCWVATVPITTFEKINEETKDEEIAALLIGAQQEGAPLWAKKQMVDFPNEEFMSSETSKAFFKFIREWTAKKE